MGGEISRQRPQHGRMETEVAMQRVDSGSLSAESERVQLQPAYDKDTGHVNHDTLYKIYQQLRTELVETLNKEGVSSHGVNSTLDGLLGAIDFMRDQPILASDPDYQYEIHTQMKKAVAAIDQAFDICQKRDPEGWGVFKLAVMSTVARYLQHIHGYRLMTLQENGFSDQDERQKKFRLNESKLEAHTVSGGLGGGLVDGMTGQLVTATQATGSLTLQERTFVDPNGPPVILDGFEIRCGGRQTTQTHFENAQDGTPESNYKPLYTGSGFGGWVNLRHESLVGVSDVKDTYYNNFNRNTRTYDEAALLGKTVVEKNTGLWDLRNRFVNSFSDPQNLKHKIAKKQLDCDKQDANRGDSRENSYWEQAKRFIRTAEGWGSIKVGRATQTDPRPISSIEGAKGANPSELLDYVSLHSVPHGLISPRLAKMVSMAYSDLDTPKRPDEIGLPPFRGYITTLGVNGYVNYIPSPGVWGFDQPNQTIPSSFFNVSVTGQATYERSKWVFNFDQAPSEWLNPSVNLQANSTLEQIENTAPHLLGLRKFLLEACGRRGDLDVVQYLKILKLKNDSFVTLARQYRAAYTNYLDDKNKEKGRSEEKLLSAAKELVWQMMPSLDLDKGTVRELALHHHEEFLSMAWTSLSLAAGLYPNTTFPAQRLAESASLEPPRQPVERSEGMLLSEVQSEQRIISMENEELNVRGSQRAEEGQPVPALRINAEEGDTKNAFAELNQLKAEINQPSIAIPLVNLYQKCPFRYQIKGMDTGLGSLQCSVGIPYVLAANPRNSTVSRDTRAGLTMDTIRVGVQMNVTGTDGHHDRSRDGYLVNAVISLGSGLPAVRAYALQAAQSYFQQQCENTALPTSVREGLQALLRSWPGAATFGVEFQTSDTLVNQMGDTVNNPNYNTLVGGLGHLTSGSVSMNLFKVDPVDQKNKTEFKLQSISLLGNEEATATLGLNLNITPVTANLNYGYSSKQGTATLTRLYNEPTVHMAQYPQYFEKPVKELQKRIADIEARGSHPPSLSEIMLSNDVLNLADLARVSEIQIREALSVQPGQNPEHAQALRTLYNTYFHGDGHSFADIVESGLNARNRLPGVEGNENTPVNGFTNLALLHSSEAHWQSFMARPYPSQEEIDAFRTHMKALRDEREEGAIEDRQLVHIFRTPEGQKMLNAYMDLVGAGVKMRLSGRLGTSTQSGTCALRPNQAVINNLAEFKHELAKRREREAEGPPGLNA